MSRLDELEGPGTTARLARAMFWGIFGVAALATLFVAVFGIAALVSSMASGITSFTLETSRALPPAADAGAPTIVHGSFSTAEVAVRDAPAEAVALSTVAAVAAILTQAAIPFSVAMLTWRLLRGAPFRRSLSTSLTVAGLVILFGGLVWQAGAAISATMAAIALNGTTEFWPIAGRFDFTTLGLGLTLLLVALVASFGERLQRETDGLV